MSGPSDRPDSVATVKAAWGDDAADWLIVLAEACNATSQAKVAKQIDYSGPVISAVLNRKYKGDLEAVEKAVLGALKGKTVACPVLGDITGDLCLTAQRKPYAAHNPASVRQYRACRAGCAHSRLDKGAKS